jgi:hypothetical protein
MSQKLETGFQTYFGTKVKSNFAIPDHGLEDLPVASLNRLRPARRHRYTRPKRVDSIHIRSILQSVTSATSFQGDVNPRYI